LILAVQACPALTFHGMWVCRVFVSGIFTPVPPSGDKIVKISIVDLKNTMHPTRLHQRIYGN